jgi:hypothetical protein
MPGELPALAWAPLLPFGVAHESDEASLLDRAFDHALVACAIAGSVSGDDPPLPTAESLEGDHVLVVHTPHLSATETATRLAYEPTLLWLLIAWLSSGLRGGRLRGAPRLFWRGGVGGAHGFLLLLTVGYVESAPQSTR